MRPDTLKIVKNKKGKDLVVHRPGTKMDEKLDGEEERRVSLVPASSVGEGNETECGQEST